MNSRLYRLLDVTRKENKELSERVAQLEKEVEDAWIINDQLSNSYAKTYGDLIHERKINDSLVKHSHILFEKLRSMEAIRMVMPNLKETKVEPKSNKIPTLEERVKAIRPTFDDLEEMFKETIADGTKD